MATIGTDLRYGARSMRRNPMFTAIAVLTLALGIGANAAIFSVVRTVLLQPLPFRQPDQLVQLTESRLDRGWTHSSFTHANFYDVRALNRSLESAGALTWSSLNLTGFDHPEQLSGGLVSASFFKTLGVTAVAGRLFADGEDEAGAETHVTVLSHRLWTTRFGSDKAIVGRSLTLAGVGHTVIGVLPPGTPWLDAADLFVPLVHTATEDRGSFELMVVGRLKPGVTIDAARSDLNAVGRRIAEQYPEAKGMGVTVEPSSRWVASDDLRRALWVLTGAVGFLLLIACVNLANLLLARATGRIRERAVRTALGASRSRVVQTALSESLLLGVFGGAVGLALAVGIVRFLRGVNPGGIPRLGEVTVDGWVLTVTLGMALLTSLVTGLVPALRVPAHHLVAALREGERSVVGNRSAGRLRGALVGIEVALSLILLVGAGLLVRSFGQILGIERGFQTEHRLLFEVGMPEARSEADVPRGANLLAQFVTRVQEMPQVTSAAAVSMRPLRGMGTGMGFAAADKPSPPSDAVPWASWRRITKDYFRTLGVPLVAGRDFNEQDKRGGPWRVIISKRVAEQLWPGANAVGRQIILWKGQTEIPAEVIGVAGDMRDWALASDPSLAVYLPYYGLYSETVHFVVHTTAPSSDLVPRLQAALAELDRTLPLSNVRSMDEMVDRSVASRRFMMMLLASLAGLALLLALAGVYGVLSYTVSRRKAEIGMRMALGASRANVLLLILGQGMRPVAIGLVAGIAGAFWLSRFMATLLFGITPLDLPTYAGVVALLSGAAVVSCWLPARDAMQVDVVAALREE